MTASGLTRGIPSAARASDGHVEARFLRDERTLWRETLHGLVLLPAGADSPLVLSAPADTIWQLLAQPWDIDALCNTLAEMYGQPVGRVAADVEPMLAEIVRRGAVKRER